MFPQPSATPVNPASVLPPTPLPDTTPASTPAHGPPFAHGIAGGFPIVRLLSWPSSELARGEPKDGNGQGGRKRADDEGC